MQAVLLTAPQTLEVRDLPPPIPADGEVLVQVHTAGICGTDLHSYHGRNPLLTMPRILGHELSGTVVAGPLPRGARVALDPMLTCGHCRPCRLGRRNCCVEMQVLGVHVDGGFREQIAVPASLCHELPENVSFELGALVEPLTIGANAVLRGDVTAADDVVIQGAGAIGLAALLAARLRGARTIVIDTVASRLEVAKAIGADEAIDASTTDDLAAVLELTGGEGAGVVIDASGRIEVLRHALDLVAAAGIVVTLIISPAELSFGATEYLIKKELDVRGSRLNRDLFPSVLESLASGAIDPRPMVTQRFVLAEAPPAFELLSEHPDQALKVLLQVAG